LSLAAGLSPDPQLKALPMQTLSGINGRDKEGDDGREDRQWKGRKEERRMGRKMGV